LGSILESEKNYLDALKRILEVGNVSDESKKATKQTAMKDCD